jgi:hypothetical protein
MVYSATDDDVVQGRHPSLEGPSKYWSRAEKGVTWIYLRAANSTPLAQAKKKKGYSIPNA